MDVDCFSDLPPLFPELEDLEDLLLLNLDNALAITTSTTTSPAISPRNIDVMSPLQLPKPAWPERKREDGPPPFLPHADPDALLNVSSLDSPPLNSIQVRRFLSSPKLIDRKLEALLATPVVVSEDEEKKKKNEKKKRKAELIAQAEADIKLMDSLFKKEEVTVDQLATEESKKRQRKQQMFEDGTYYYQSKVVIAAQKSEVRVPQSHYEARQCMVNAIATVLPIEGEIDVLGLRCPVIVLGAVYIGTQLNWIVMSRVNHRLYLNKHLVQDAEHLYESMIVSGGKERRRNMPHRPKDVHRTLKFYPTIGARMKNEAYEVMKIFPEHLRKFPTNNNNQSALSKVQDFLQSKGKAGDFFELFGKKHVTPEDKKALEAIYDPRLHGVVNEAVRGWCCFHKNRVDTRIEYVTAIEKMRRARDTSTQSSLQADIVTALPTILELNDKNADIVNHFATFVQYIKTHKHQMFYPSTTFVY